MTHFLGHPVNGMGLYWSAQLIPVFLREIQRPDDRPLPRAPAAACYSKERQRSDPRRKPDARQTGAGESPLQRRPVCRRAYHSTPPVGNPRRRILAPAATCSRLAVVTFGRLTKQLLSWDRITDLSIYRRTHATSVKVSAQLKWNWNKTETKLFRNCYVSVSFQLCGQFNAKRMPASKQCPQKIRQLNSITPTSKRTSLPHVHARTSSIDFQWANVAIDTKRGNATCTHLKEAGAISRYQEGKKPSQK